MCPPHLRQNSAPPFGKSWIRHCFQSVYLYYSDSSENIKEKNRFRVRFRSNINEPLCVLRQSPSLYENPKGPLTPSVRVNAATSLP